MNTFGSLIFYKMLARMLRKTSYMVGIQDELAKKDIDTLNSREMRMIEKRAIKRSIKDSVFIKFILELIDIVVLVAFLGMIGMCYAISKHYFD